MSINAIRMNQPQAMAPTAKKTQTAPPSTSFKGGRLDAVDKIAMGASGATAATGIAMKIGKAITAGADGLQEMGSKIMEQGFGDNPTGLMILGAAMPVMYAFGRMAEAISGKK